MGNECQVPSLNAKYLEVQRKQFLNSKTQNKNLTPSSVLKAVKTFDHKPPKLPRLRPIPQNTTKSFSSLEDDLFENGLPTAPTLEPCPRSRRRLDTQSEIALRATRTRNSNYKAAATGVLPSAEDFTNLGESMTCESHYSPSGCLSSLGDATTGHIPKLHFGRFETIR